MNTVTTLPETKLITGEELFTLGGGSGFIQSSSLPTLQPTPAHTDTKNSSACR
jgi:hypothetical protein